MSRLWVVALLFVALATAGCAATPGGWSVNFNLNLVDGWYYPYYPTGYWRAGYWGEVCEYRPFYRPYRACHKVWVPREWVPY